MANGLDLNGLNGEQIQANEFVFVGVTQSAGGAYQINSALGSLARFASSPTEKYTLIPVNSSVQSNQSLAFLATVSPGGFSQPNGSAGLKLVGWNEDGLLFAPIAHTGGGDEYVFIGDPNGPTTVPGIPGNTVFGTSSSVAAPFGLAPLTPACFAAGTHIRTVQGEIAVEELIVGDSVLTLSGAAKAIKWIGNRRVNGRRHPRPNEVMPVRVKAHAFGENLPLRDLLVSPGHSIYVDGVLIPAGFLLNGATVVQEDVETIYYYHIELDAHDIVLAEGLPAESYLDDENRHAFSNGADHTALHPDLDPKSWENACAPRVMAGPQLTDVKQRLIDQADGLGYHLLDATDVHLMADGVRIEPSHTAGSRHWFIVPAGSRNVLLNSNSGVPMQLIADHGDGRRLGIAVSELKANGKALALDQVLKANPYPIETHGDLSWVWTDGSASLEMTVPADAPTMVEVAFIMSMKSWSRKPTLSVVRALDAVSAG
jgi:hypothetical protein